MDEWGMFPALDHVLSLSSAGQHGPTCALMRMAGADVMASRYVCAVEGAACPCHGRAGR